MLNTLDTVIAFAVIMTILSLLITIAVQMVSTTLSLRGKNLANALALTFQTIDPKIGGFAHSLAAQILRDPIFSDSIFRPKIVRRSFLVRKRRRSSIWRKKSKPPRNSSRPIRRMQTRKAPRRLQRQN